MLRWADTHEPGRDHVSPLIAPTRPMLPARPAGRGRGDTVSTLTDLGRPVLLSKQSISASFRCFNPHRPRKASAPLRASACCARPVSTLIGPTGPMLRQNDDPTHTDIDVSTLIGPAGGSRLRSHPPLQAVLPASFTPQRSQEADATP
jgi:hypothetical protein